MLKQFPKPQQKVKQRRKILLTLNATQPPKVRLPKLVDGSLKNAVVLLKAHQLILGDVQYVPDLAENAVLAQYHDGKKLHGGELVPQGAVIDLNVGDGFGNQTFKTPYVVGLPFEEAEIIIQGSGLRLRGTYLVEHLSELPKDSTTVVASKLEPKPGTICKQRTPKNQPINRNSPMDIWIYQP